MSETVSVTDAMRITKLRKSTLMNLVPFDKEHKIGKAEFDAWWVSHQEAAEEKTHKRPAGQDRKLDELGNEKWHEMFLDVAPNGNLKSTAANARIVMKMDEGWKGVFTHNAFTCQTLVYGEMPQPSAGHRYQQQGGDGYVVPAPITDEEVWMAKVWLEDSKYRISIPKDQVRAIIESEAKQTSYHPVVEYLEKAWENWDKQPRIDTWLSTYLGVEQNEYSKYAGRWWLISAVARVMEPGCQVDHVLVLEGDQGVGKSTALRTLAVNPEWFLDSDLDLHSKETAMLLRGRWIVEFAELGGMRKSDRERIKGFFTTHTDTIIPKFANYEQSYKRQCVFAATVNHDQYLNDEENRRFWPVQVNGMAAHEWQLDNEGLKRDLDQLWGEAKNAYSAFLACKDCKAIGKRCRDHRWWPTKAEQEEWFSPEQAKRKTVDPWMDKVSKWMMLHVERMKQNPSTSEVLAGIGIPDLEQTEHQEKRLRLVIRAIGRYEAKSTYVAAVKDAEGELVSPSCLRSAWHAKKK